MPQKELDMGQMDKDVNSCTVENAVDKKQLLTFNTVDQKGQKQLDTGQMERITCLCVSKDVNRTVGACFMSTSCTVENASQNMVH